MSNENVYWDELGKAVSIQYKIENKTRIFRMTKQQAIKFFACLKKELESKRKNLNLTISTHLLDKHNFTEKREYIESIFEPLKILLKKLTGK